MMQLQHSELLGMARFIKMPPLICLEDFAEMEATLQKLQGISVITYCPFGGKIVNFLYRSPKNGVWRHPWICNEVEFLMKISQSAWGLIKTNEHICRESVSNSVVQTEEFEDQLLLLVIRSLMWTDGFYQICSIEE